MLAGESDKLLGQRLERLEDGVHKLDDRVAALDQKVGHVMELTTNVMVSQEANFRETRTMLNEHKAELKKSIKQIRGRWSTQCYITMFASGLTLWTILMAWFIWS